MNKIVRIDEVSLSELQAQWVNSFYLHMERVAMIKLERIPNEYCADHLLLLVGANPLPNYVAARLLTKPGSTIHLLHTQVTGESADSLQKVIKEHQKKVTFELWQVDPADSTQIQSKVKEIVQTIQRSESVGLNYTGGTKTMAVHTYRVLEQTKQPIIFSYLDAQTLTLRFDGIGGEQTRSIDVGKVCTVNLNELAQLHGFAGFSHTPEQVTNNNLTEDILAALVEIHLTQEGYEQWREYGGTAYVDLPDLHTWPVITPFMTAIEQHLGINATAEQVAGAMGRFPQLVSYSKWFNGTWLEEYVLRQLATLPANVGINSYGMGIEPIVEKAIQVLLLLIWMWPPCVVTSFLPSHAWLPA
ncbi:MAG: DUF1887 family CARF protein [Caldilineaceae bacterium]